jgi:carboxyl-terminal processing protease
MLKKRMNGGLATVVAVVLILAVMATSFFAGLSVGHGSAPNYVIGGAAVPKNLQQPLDDLWQSYKYLNADSYWRPFDGKQLLYAATSGMVDTSTLPQDSHTLYFPPVASQAATAQLNEGSYGIGANVSMGKAGLTIIQPLYDSPAQKAGLRAGDLITKVDGRGILKMSETDAVNLIHGQDGTVVSLLIVRSGVAKPFTVRVTRGSIPDVLVSKTGSVGYIQFSVFGLQTATEFHGALTKLLSQHITSLIIDLRDNGGGYVETAQAIAGEFLPKDSVLLWERTNLGGGKYSDASTLVTTTGIAQHLPIVVLVNGGTASAAEIFAAALREHGRAKTIGARTYGKDSVQEVLNFPDGSSLRITIHQWLTPDKHSISGGFLPDIVVNQPSVGADAQLQRAIQYLNTDK